MFNQQARHIDVLFPSHLPKRARILSIQTPPIKDRYTSIKFYQLNPQKFSTNLSINIQISTTYLKYSSLNSSHSSSAHPILSLHIPYNSLLTSPPLLVINNAVKPTPIMAPNHTSPNSFSLLPISNLFLKRSNKITKMRIRVSSLLTSTVMEKPSVDGQGQQTVEFVILGWEMVARLIVLCCWVVV